MATNPVPMTNYKARLMAWDTIAKKWEMVVATKGNPDLGGDPEMIDASTNEDSVQVNIPGRQSLSTLKWETNYDKATFKDIQDKYEDHAVHHFAQWFGEEGNGEDGIFEFDGYLTAYVGQADSYGLIPTTIVIGNTTPIKRVETATAYES